MTPRFSVWQMRGFMAMCVPATWAATEAGWMGAWNWWWAGASFVGGSLVVLYGKRREL